MRNLTILSETAVAVPEGFYFVGAKDGNLANRRPTAAACVDVTTKTTYAIVGDDHDSAYIAKMQTGEEGHEQFVLGVPLPFSASSAALSGVQCLMERESLFVALQSGDIFAIQVGTDKIEAAGVDLVGTVDPGIMASSWSPDEELLALVTGEAKLLLMTQDFDVLDEFPLAQGEHGEEVPVALGWGRKETQYQGSSATAKTAGSAPEATEEDQIPADDDHCVRISWRGDGAYFSISFIRNNAREIRVFSREGKLHSICESIDALEHTLCWRPSGRLIAATQKLPHKHDVVFFERNGLRHGEFTLRKDTRRVLDLSFNADSSILAVTALVDTGKDKPEICVELWTDKNYHWYLKQELRVSGHVLWDAEDPMCLHAIGSLGSYSKIRLHSTPAVAHVASEESNGAACVIDGTQLLYTPFSYSNVPPPMALYTVGMPLPATHLAFAAFGPGNDFAVLLADRRTVLLYECKHAKTVREGEPPKELTRISIPGDINVRQIAWPAKDQLACLGVSASRGEMVSLLDIGGSGEVVVRKQLSVERSVRIYSAPHAGCVVLVEDAAGNVSALDIETDKLSTASKLPVMCPDIDAVCDANENALTVVGRSERNQLFANDHLVSAACSSFYLRKDLLAFTTTTHLVRFVPVSRLATAFVDEAAAAAASANEANNRNVSKYDESCRRVERGSTIVLALPVDDRIVFQMPRGNLETVRPRALVLASVRRLLEMRHYREALITCRVNRIDMNFVFDHIADQLIDDFGEFVQQINDPDLLNLFVSGLRDEDVTQTMFTGLTSNDTDAAAEKAVAVDQKTTTICKRLRKVLQDSGEKKYMPTILTTFMCETPADIASALQLLAPLSTDERDDALTYLLFLSDVDTVYNAALGLYDLPLALLVAQRSQRDPREYLASLGTLNAIRSEEYRRYKIDSQLGRARLALEHLCEAYRADSSLWGEVVEFVNANSLHQSALRIFADDKLRHSDICVEYGNHLANTNDWAQSAAAYLLGNATRQAVDAFVQAKEWRMALALAAAPGSGFDTQVIHDTAVKASGVLAERHMFMTAAAALLEYTAEDEEALSLLVKGKHWAEALRTARLRDRSDLIETTVYPGMQSAYSEIDEEIDEISESFKAKVERLRELRAKPLEVLIEQNMERAVQDVDVMSDTASMASQFSTFTATVSNASSRMTGSTVRRISKSRRKEERKRVRGKKGSIYEESYLVDSISKLINRVRAAQIQVREMCLALVHFALAPQACELQKKFYGLVSQVRESGDWVFDEQRVQMQMGENGIPEPVPAETNEHGLASEPKHPKPKLPGFDDWYVSSLLLE
ncbi:putative elongator complex protein 1 [Coemansia sp. RSA 1813]|nr:putative elongator complex protein 1 [Coemansia sp. RSA 1646]KAJ1767067.1 putative elongator complex protein 1 [Coemansia sp. RSA 1843]KAJ2088053.1 putative elongator complex protein 1 [Coemansia sp. RSA 986]KAJ2210766.1 putative elongator complex protein 1 [Coemansia sp. RSA 487]KAJ2568028.1 putative elongator complex protein 1 [Coemansia sp. RSA 1813]